MTDSAGMTPFLLAASRGYLQLCSVLMDHMTSEQIQAVDKHGRNALVLAISNTHVHVASFLITKGFSSQFKSPAPREWNLLFFAVATKSEPVVKFCLEQGISPLETCGVGFGLAQRSFIYRTGWMRSSFRLKTVQRQSRSCCSIIRSLRILWSRCRFKQNERKPTSQSCFPP